jgi:hypothetical protein
MAGPTTLTTAQVRQRVAATLAGVDGWIESPVSYDRFPADPGQFSDHKFAVWAPRTIYEGVEAAPGRRPIGGMATTTIGIRWTRAIRADGAVEDGDQALDDEAALQQALADIDRNGGLHLTVEALDRKVVGDGTWMLGEITARATYRSLLA